MAALIDATDRAWFSTRTPEGSPREVVNHLGEAFHWYMTTLDGHLAVVEGTDPQLSMFRTGVWELAPPLIRDRALAVSDGFLLAHDEGRLMGAPEPVRSQVMPRRHALHSALIIAWAGDLTSDLGECGTMDLLGSLAPHFGGQTLWSWWQTMDIMPTEYVIDHMRGWKEQARAVHVLHGLDQLR